MANKYENLNKIQAEFDFHNLGVLTPQEIYSLAADFIQNSQKNNPPAGGQKISFIVGQGKHSKNGPVIKPLLKKYLENHPDVAKVSLGKFAQGGEGVLVVDLI
ncbi:Smr/MutS family protein [Patescibacteria group bacterium]|nr:Smr/MutS family protein [Patescibacteria group bacterium]